MQSVPTGGPGSVRCFLFVREMMGNGENDCTSEGCKLGKARLRTNWPYGFVGISRKKLIISHTLSNLSEKLTNKTTSSSLFTWRLRSWRFLRATKGPIVFWSELDGDGARSERDWPRCLDYSSQCSCSRALAASHALCKAGLKQSTASSPNLYRSSNPALWDNQIRIQSGIKTLTGTCQQVCQLPQNLPTN